MKTELLAPAKNIEIAKSAIDAGADAVYIGCSAFGARSKATNSIDDIKQLVQYAHKFYSKVYVTVNTILKDNELDDVKNLINQLYNIGVDALIVQDMAIIDMAINKEIPPIPLHLSTQCDNRDIEKIKFYSQLGVARVVLARELSKKQIAEIIKTNPQIEIETFIHGALCVSYSGQCYLSHFIGGRSANRGECAQPCRKKYSLVDDKGNILVKDKHLLSLKDFNASKHIKELVKIGVKSFKIEGRMKDEPYVKNVVGYYRKILDLYSDKTSSGTVDLGFEPDINKTFNRDYTSFFLENREKCFNFQTPKFIGEYVGSIKRIDKNWFEIQTDKNILFSAQDGLTFGSDGNIGCLINKAVKNRIYPNKMPNIKNGDRVYRNIDTNFLKQLNNSKTVRKIRLNIEYKNKEIIGSDEDGNVSKLIIEEFEIAQNTERNKENFIKSFNKTGDSDFVTVGIDIKDEIPFIPVSKMNDYRRLLLNKIMEERLNNYKKTSQKELDYVNYYKDTDDYRANVANKKALEFYKKCNCNILEPALEIQTPKRQVELMRTKHCIKYALNKCKSNDKLYLVDEKGTRYPLLFDCKNCEMAVMSNTQSSFM